VNRVFNVSGFSLGINIRTSKLSRKKMLYTNVLSISKDVKRPFKCYVAAIINLLFQFGFGHNVKDGFDCGFKIFLLLFSAGHGFTCSSPIYK